MDGDDRGALSNDPGDWPGLPEDLLSLAAEIKNIPDLQPDPSWFNRTKSRLLLQLGDSAATDPAE
ncbi:MAG TPA: hypothetical protein VKU60_02955 [Chloroflexota bacterium]|nr:hypothetical protein [Chloroflexota bacterium]